MIRRIRELLYEQGFTISGARNRLQELVQHEKSASRAGDAFDGEMNPIPQGALHNQHRVSDDLAGVRQELVDIRNLLTAALGEPEIKAII